MDQLSLLQLGGKISWGLFIFALGACCGSLTNVLVYRLPHGLDVVTAPSRCPCCGTRLTWRENIPVLGWLALRGRCRFCRSAISPEYPMVEAFGGLLFLAVFTLWYLIPTQATWLGMNWGALRPEWAASDAFDGFPRTTWGPLIAVLALFGSLTAMTLVDVKTFTIPLQLPWFATIAGIVFHTAGAAWVGRLREHAPPPILTHWAIPEPGGWWWIGAAVGGVVGLGVGIMLLHFGLIRRSFADYQEWEGKALAQAAVQAGVDPATAAARDLPMTAAIENAASVPELHTAGPVGENAGAGAWLTLRFIAVFLVLCAFATFVGWLASTAIHGVPAWSGLAVGCVAGPVFAALVIRPRARALAAQPQPTGETVEDGASAGVAVPTPAKMWIQYPYARREMVKEVLFLTPCVGLAWLGATLAVRLGSATPPFWLSVLCATLMGYLIGGGVVWGVRIFASLAFGKEAIGLGDVHLMAAVGACVGWIDAALAFPLAAAVGLYCTAITWIMTGTIGRALPFGPHLAAATVLVVLGKPLVELGLSRLLHAQVNLP